MKREDTPRLRGAESGTLQEASDLLYRDSPREQMTIAQVLDEMEREPHYPPQAWIDAIRAHIKEDEARDERLLECEKIIARRNL